MGDLILESLEVHQFRVFRHLQIPKLGRVNLITGKCSTSGRHCLRERSQSRLSFCPLVASGCLRSARCGTPWC